MKRFPKTCAALSTVFLLTACGSDVFKPRLVKPDVPASLFACPPGPGSVPEGATWRDIAKRDLQWRADHAECRDKLDRVRRIIDAFGEQDAE